MKNLFYKYAIVFLLIILSSAFILSTHSYEYSFSNSDFEISNKRNAELNSELIGFFCKFRDDNFCQCAMGDLYKKSSIVDRILIYNASRSVFFRPYNRIKIRNAIFNYGETVEFANKLEKDAGDLTNQIISHCQQLK